MNKHSYLMSNGLQTWSPGMCKNIASSCLSNCSLKTSRVVGKGFRTGSPKHLRFESNRGTCRLNNKALTESSAGMELNRNYCRDGAGWGFHFLSAWSHYWNKGYCCTGSLLKDHNESTRRWKIYRTHTTLSKRCSVCPVFCSLISWYFHNDVVLPAAIAIFFLQNTAVWTPQGGIWSLNFIFSTSHWEHIFWQWGPDTNLEKMIKQAIKSAHEVCYLWYS